MKPVHAIYFRPALFSESVEYIQRHSHQHVRLRTVDREAFAELHYTRSMKIIFTRTNLPLLVLETVKSESDE